MWQRHTAACPRSADGELLPHRCRGSWGCVVDAGRRPDGGRRQATRSGFATKREAQQALDTEVARQQAGVRQDRPLTVAEYLEEWLTAKRNLRDTTRRSYAMHIRRYLTPSLGH